MATVTVRLFHELKLAAGESEMKLEAGSVGELIQRLIQKYGTSLRDVMFDKGGKLRSYTLVYLNNTVLSPLDTTTKLNDGDLILLIPPAAGG